MLVHFFYFIVKYTVKSLFFLFIFLLTTPSFAQLNYNELKELQKRIEESKKTLYPIGEILTTPTSPSLTGLVVLHRNAPNAPHREALAVRARALLNNDGSISKFIPLSDQDIQEKLNRSFYIYNPDLRIKLIQDQDRIILKAQLHVYFEVDLPPTTQEIILKYIKEGIEESWKGTLGSKEFSSQIEVQKAFECPLCDPSWTCGKDHFDVFISLQRLRSFVIQQNQSPRIGYWEMLPMDPQFLKKRYAHEFGHFIGFDDLYSDVAYYDFSGNLLSTTQYTFLSLYSPLTHVSPITDAPSFMIRNFDQNNNIMANDSMGHVLPGHIESIIRKYSFTK